jgi:hypothetical protein
MQLPNYRESKALKADGDVADRVLVLALRLKPEGSLWRYTLVFVLLRQSTTMFQIQ